MYTPNPIRCRKCLKFGHFGDKCTKEPICNYCSKPAHKGEACESIVPNCVNCGNHHPSLDVNCPRFLEEKAIKTIQFKDKVPYNVAKRKYKETHPIIGNKSFADAARNSRKVGVDAGTQTDVFISDTKQIRATSSKNVSTESAFSRPPPLASPPRALTPPLPPSTASPPLPSPATSPPLAPPATPPLHPASTSSPTLPPSERTPSTPRSRSPQDSRSHAPQPLSGEQNPGIFKAPQQPRRNSLSKRNNKNKKNKGVNLKSDDEMETT